MKNPLFQDATTVVMNPMHVQEDWSKPLDSKANKHFIPENLWSTVISESQTILYADHNFREPQEPSVAKRIKDFVMRTLHSISLYFKANTYFRYDLQHVYSHTHLLVLFNLIASSCCTGVVVRPLHSLSTFSLFPHDEVPHLLMSSFSSAFVCLFKHLRVKMFWSWYELLSLVKGHSFLVCAFSLCLLYSVFLNELFSNYYYQLNHISNDSLYSVLIK